MLAQVHGTWTVIENPAGIVHLDEPSIKKREASEEVLLTCDWVWYGKYLCGIGYTPYANV